MPLTRRPVRSADFDEPARLQQGPHFLLAERRHGLRRVALALDRLVVPLLQAQLFDRPGKERAHLRKDDLAGAVAERLGAAIGALRPVFGLQPNVEALDVGGGYALERSIAQALDQNIERPAIEGDGLWAEAIGLL